MSDSKESEAMPPDSTSPSPPSPPAPSAPPVPPPLPTLRRIHTQNITATRPSHLRPQRHSRDPSSVSSTPLDPAFNALPTNSIVSRMKEKLEARDVKSPTSATTNPEALSGRPHHDLKEDRKVPWIGKERRDEIRGILKKGEGPRRGKAGLDRGRWELWEGRGKEEEDGTGGLWQGESKGEESSSAKRRKSTLRGGVEEREGQPGEGHHEQGQRGTQGHRPTIPTLFPEAPPRATLTIAPPIQNPQPTHPIPKGVDPFTYALGPWLAAHPAYKQYLDTSSTTSSSASLPSSTSPAPSEISAASHEAFPEIPYESLALYTSSKKELQMCIQALHVRTLLMRCAALWTMGFALQQSGVRKLASSAEEEEGGKLWYKYYSKAGKAAEKAEKMARDLGSDGLQARAWYWIGRTAGGRGYWDEAWKAFQKAVEFDPPTDAEVEEGANVEGEVEGEEESGAGSFVVERGNGKKEVDLNEYGSHGLTPMERADVRILLERTKERDDRDTERRKGRDWAEKVSESDNERGEEEEREEEEPLNPYKEQSDTEEKLMSYQGEPDVSEMSGGVAEVWQALKEKRTMQRVEPFSAAEESYILVLPEVNMDNVARLRKTMDEELRKVPSVVVV